MGSKSSLIQNLTKYPFKFSFTKALDVLLSYSGVNVSNIKYKDLSVVDIYSSCNLQSKFCDIEKVNIENNKKYSIAANLVGIVGVDSVMTDEYLEKYILHQDRETREAIFDFLNILSNSILSLRYLFLKKHDVECLSSDMQNSSIGMISLSLSGMDYFSKQDHDSFQNQDEDSYLQYKKNQIQDQLYTTVQNFLWSYARSGEGLRCILYGFFKVPVYVEQFVGSFVEVDDDLRSKIGINGSYNVLGINTYLGSSVWDSSVCINILVGPLEYSQYVEFLPKKSEYDKPSSTLEKMKKIIRDYVPMNYSVRIYIFLDRGSVGYSALNMSSRLYHDAFIGGNKYNYNTFFMEEI